MPSGSPVFVWSNIVSALADEIAKEIIRSSKPKPYSRSPFRKIQVARMQETKSNNEGGSGVEMGSFTVIVSIKVTVGALEKET